MFKHSVFIDAMAEATKKTVKEHPYEDRLIGTAIGMLLSTMLLIEKAKRPIKKNSKLAVLMLAVRNLRLLYCAADLLDNGFYDTCFVVLRSAFENGLLMKYLKTREDEAREWALGKRITPSKVRSGIKWQKAGKGIYGFMSNLVHANIEGAIFSVSILKKGMEFHAMPEYNSSFYDMCSKLLISIIWITLPLFQHSFRDILWKNDRWVEEYVALNNEVSEFMKKMRVGTKNRKKRGG